MTRLVVLDTDEKDPPFVWHLEDATVALVFDTGERFVPTPWRGGLVLDGKVCTVEVWSANPERWTIPHGSTDMLNGH
jgi:hypothetical protein